MGHSIIVRSWIQSNEGAQVRQCLTGREVILL